jgi:hypothetical protein
MSTRNQTQKKHASVIGKMRSGISTMPIEATLTDSDG